MKITSLKHSAEVTEQISVSLQHHLKMQKAR